MARTAVGLFENPGSVEEVVRDLVACGFPQSDVRVLSEPRDMPGSRATSLPCQSLSNTDLGNYLISGSGAV
jgi:hypothetical protein